MKAPLRLTLLVPIFSLALTQVPSASSMGQEEIRERLERAYETIAEAEKAGEKMKLGFLPYREGSDEPYRSLN